MSIEAPNMRPLQPQEDGNGWPEFFHLPEGIEPPPFGVDAEIMQLASDTARRLIPSRSGLSARGAVRNVVYLREVLEYHANAPGIEE